MGPWEVAWAGPARAGGSGCPQSCLHLEARVLQGSWVRCVWDPAHGEKNISLKCKSWYFRLWPCGLPDVSLCWTRSELHLPVPEVLWSGSTAAPATCPLPASWRVCAVPSGVTEVPNTGWENECVQDSPIYWPLEGKFRCLLANINRL